MAILTNDSNGNVTGNVEWVWPAVSWEWWEIIQLLLAIIGIAGNLLVILVIFWPGRRRCATDTLIGALAVADFLTSIFIIPHTKASQLPDTISAEIYCRIVHSSFFMWISICASIFTLTTLSVERLLAVRFPNKFYRLFSPKRTSLAIIAIWIMAFLINTLSLYGHFIADNVCVFSLSVPFHRFIGVGLFLVEYLIPVIIMITAHIWTIHTLRKRRATVLRAAQKQILEMLLIVVITFLICWTPDQFGFLVFNLGVIHFSHLFSPLYRWLVIIAFINSCANPLIYAARMPRFRKALASIFQIKSVRHAKILHSVFAGDAEDSTSRKTDQMSKTTESQC